MVDERPQGTSPRELAREVWEDESPAAGSGAVPPEHRLRDVPIGLDARGLREERDSLGTVLVPADRYWGAQTQRSLEHFGGDTDRMPLALIHAYGEVKRAAALANAAIGVLPAWKAEAIAAASAEVARGELDDHFPLGVLQSGSGTHTNANVDEVVANRANQLLGAALGSGDPVHPNDDVNRSQSSNDTFVTAMHVAAYAAVSTRTSPALARLAASLERRAVEWRDVLKVGRTHLMDAVPLSVGDEWSGYVAAVVSSADHLSRTMADLRDVALGGTAVGTGINAPAGFSALAVETLASITGQPLRPATNRFAAQATLDALVRVHAALAGVAVTMFKVANDLRWMASGPYSGLAELRIPANEPGSTIMPGKVNPTQAEAALMACVLVQGNHVTVSLAGAEGNFELNAFRPVVISTFLRSALALAESAEGLSSLLVDGARLDEARLAAGVERSVMVVTALAPSIGYDRAAQIVHDAVAEDIPPREAALRHGVDGADYDRAVAALHRH